MKYIMADVERFQGYSHESFIHNPIDRFFQGLSVNIRSRVFSTIKESLALFFFFLLTYRSGSNREVTGN